jgi:hypothetical protein
MTLDASGEGLAAALIQIAGHAERISGLDAREADHYQDIASRLGELTAEAASLSTCVDGISTTLRRQAAIVDALDGLDTQVAALARHLPELADDEDDELESRYYQPIPPPRWWKITGTERDAAIERLRAWVDQIYRPSYGQLAAMLPACWEHHSLCLYLLDWLSELWSVLYLGPPRTGNTLAAQGEWQTRLLPAAAEQMAYETSSCSHSPDRRQPSGDHGTTRRTTDGASRLDWLRDLPHDNSVR